MEGKGIQHESEYPGKFNSARDEALNTLTLHGWSNEFSGDVECPTGFFARISNTAPEMIEIVDAFAADFKELGLTDISELVGHFLLIEDASGFVNVTAYENAEELQYDYKRLLEIYHAWSEDQQP